MEWYYGDESANQDDVDTGASTTWMTSGASTTWRPCCPALEELQKRKTYTKRWGMVLLMFPKSCTTTDDDYPIVYTLLIIPGGCLGFCPSTVWWKNETSSVATCWLVSDIRLTQVWEIKKATVNSGMTLSTNFGAGILNHHHEERTTSASEPVGKLETVSCTRWAPTMVINGIKWRYKWVTGVITVIYSYNPTYRS